MNWDQVEGNWQQLKGRVKARWGKLTDNDLTVINGKRQELLGLLQQRYGDTKEALEKEMDDFCNTCR